MANLVQGEWGGMPQNDVFEIENARRKRKFAEALRQQQQPNGQMVGNVFVAPSVTQRLATLLNNWQGGRQERAADQKEREIYTNRQNTITEAGKRLADALKTKQVQDGENVTTTPYNPEQMDQFGSPLPNVQREQTVTPAYRNVTPTAQDREAALLQYYTAIGDPRGMAGMVSSSIDRGFNREEKLEDRAYGEKREDKIYQRDRSDKLSDVEANREFQRIVMKEQQGHQLTMQERNFAQQWSLNKSNQSFQAGQNDLSRQNALDIASSKKPEGIDWKYDSQSDEFVASPTPEFPMGRRSGNIAKQNAGKSMQYVIDEFRGNPEAGKTGILDKTMQGGWMGAAGAAGAVFDSQDRKRFNNLREQMSTELRTLFRIPGEGTLSDREQAQYGIQLPDVTNDKTTNEAILKDIETRIRLRNDTSANPLTPKVKTIEVDY